MFCFSFSRGHVGGDTAQDAAQNIRVLQSDGYIKILIVAALPLVWPRTFLRQPASTVSSFAKFCKRSSLRGRGGLGLGLDEVALTSGLKFNGLGLGWMAFRVTVLRYLRSVFYLVQYRCRRSSFFTANVVPFMIAHHSTTRSGLQKCQGRFTMAVLHLVGKAVIGTGMPMITAAGVTTRTTTTSYAELVSTS